MYKAVEDDPDCFVSKKQLNIWFDDDYWYHDNEMIEWYKAYKKRKAQKVKIKEQLLPTAWHLDRVMNWCMPGDVWK